jgi:hypothetical protein
LAVGVALVVTAFRPGLPRRSWWRRALRVSGAVVGVLVAVLLAWLRPFPATDVALAALTPAASADGVTVTEDRSSIRFTPETGTGAGLVLYPGARVDPRAYAVLARGIAAGGHEVVVLKCPYDIAFLCAGRGGTEAAAGGVWAVGGHSLGGVVASSDVAAADAVPRGLLLWASYPVSDLSGRSALHAASVAGSLDGLSTPQDIADSAHLLPPDAVITMIEGAVHADFGDYGPQPGDGTPTIDRADAQQQIVAASVALLDRVG